MKSFTNVFLTVLAMEVSMLTMENVYATPSGLAEIATSVSIYFSI
jgi:hypothetical protein